MLDKFQHHLYVTFPEVKGKKLLLACSGGVDSMVLAHMLLQCKLHFALAHCNYKLRGDDSDLDQDLVVSWGQSQGIQVFERTFDLKDTSGSIQLKARDLRYGWFHELMRKEGFDYILTAHHADDSLETFFINLSRGTGLDGLTGIPERNGQIIRPLLPFSKEEIVSYARDNEVPWREDATNHELKYKRNKIRHAVIPALHEIHPALSQNFQKTQLFLFQSGQLLRSYAEGLKEKLFQIKGEDTYISIADLNELDPVDAHLYLLFRDYGFTQWEDLKDLLGGQSGKEISSKTHRIIKDRECIILSEKRSIEDGVVTLDEGISEIKEPFHLSIENAEKIGSQSDRQVFVDKEKLNYPLKLRKWKIGDYFYPLGMSGRKKLSKFFKDEKLNTLEKEKQWLLCSGDQIVWVLGKRMDDRFKVTEKTKTILKITWVI